MPKISYVPKTFNAEHRTIIDHANDIVNEYEAQGFDLTLRQLFYQFVSRDLLPNTLKSYKRLGGIINDARLAGLIDWERITDRTRNLASNNHWGAPGDIVRACARQFRYDLWADQKYRVEVWIEKDALSGVFDGVCRELDVDYFACRGYTSQSEMWSAGQRLKQYARNGQTPIILHFGDHDPSGVDMTRDIADRLNLFGAGGKHALQVDRLALNMTQIEEYEPPPNPAKITDSRAKGYIQRFGNESWELDALDPATLVALVRERITSLCDQKKFDEQVREQDQARHLLTRVADDWDTVTSNLPEED